MLGVGLRLRPELLATFLVLAGCTPETQRAADPEVGPVPTSVVVISIDTLRSDHLPAYGYTAVATPEIDRLAADGIVFERAFAHAPLTLPSHVSMFSGMLPSRHGVRDNLGYRVPSDIDWLPELLQERGYATAAVVSSAVLDSSTGMDRGFDHYDDGSRAQEEANTRAGGETVGAALSLLDTLESDRFFLFVHLYEPHRPYTPPAPFDVYESPYDGEIATADAALATLLDGLRSRDRYDASLIILTSDHGEGLGEHGERDHGIFVYRESLQVPLIIKLPANRGGGRREPVPVQHADLLPTVIDAVGQADSWEGDALSLLRQPALAQSGDERWIYGESYLPRLYYGVSELHTLIGPRFQYIDSPKPELFDLIEDPAGRNNLVDEHPEAIATFRRRLQPLTTKLEAGDPVGDAQRRDLAGLGYLGGAAPPVQSDLPAPSDYLELFELITRAYDARAAGRFEEARRGLRRAIELNPLAAFAWAQLARSEAALGNDEDAFRAAMRVLELTGDAPHRLLPTAQLALKIGRLEEAQELAERADAWSPAESLALRCRVAVARGELDRAQELALQTVAADSGRTAPALQVMSVLLGRGDPERALILGSSLEAQIEETPFGLNLILGQALAQVGRYDEAVTRLEREVTLFPDRPQAYGHLAVLYGRLDRPEQAGGAIDRLLRAGAGAAGYSTAVRSLIQLGFPDEALALLRKALSDYPEDPDLRRLAQAARSTP